MHMIQHWVTAAAALALTGSLAWAATDEMHATPAPPAARMAHAESHGAAPADEDHHGEQDHHGEEDHHGVEGLPPAEGDDHHDMLEEMREMHSGHAHEHKFEVIERMDPDEMRRVMSVMLELGLAMRPMDAAKGRDLFVQKGCIVCHSVNGIGGHIGPSLDAEDMPEPMNAFEFAARMWRGAGAMTAMQEELFGEQIEFTGQELADIIAFAHNVAEQKELSPEQIPERFQEMIDE